MKLAGEPSSNGHENGATINLKPSLGGNERANGGGSTVGEVSVGEDELFEKVLDKMFEIFGGSCGNKEFWQPLR